MLKINDSQQMYFKKRINKATLFVVNRKAAYPKLLSVLHITDLRTIVAEKGS